MSSQSVFSLSSQHAFGWDPPLLNQSGVTLIEILIVLSLIIILSFAILPTFRQQTTHATDTLIQTQLLQQLQRAQLLANAKGVNIGVCLSEDEKSCVNEGVTVLTFLENQHHIISSTKLKGGGKLHLRSYPYYRDYILVKPVAVAPSDNGTFSYYDQRQQFRWSIAVGQYSEPRVTSLVDSTKTAFSV